MCSHKSSPAPAATPTITRSSNGSTAVATIDNISDTVREDMRIKLASAKGKQSTNVTKGTVTESDSVKKTLLGQ